LVLSDFGLSAKVGSASRSGTRGYWSPETARREKQREPADWWSYGVTLWYCACGKQPFHRRVVRRANGSAEWEPLQPALQPMPELQLPQPAETPATSVPSLAPPQASQAWPQVDVDGVGVMAAHDGAPTEEDDHPRHWRPRLSETELTLADDIAALRASYGGSTNTLGAAGSLAPSASPPPACPVPTTSPRASPPASRPTSPSTAASPPAAASPPSKSLHSRFKFLSRGAKVGTAATSDGVRDATHAVDAAAATSAAAGAATGAADADASGVCTADAGAAPPPARRRHRITEEELNYNTCHMPVELKPSTRMPPPLCAFLTALLERDADARLGAHGSGDVTKHAFLGAHVEWGLLAQQKLVAPYVPNPSLVYTPDRVGDFSSEVELPSAELLADFGDWDFAGEPRGYRDELRQFVTKASTRQILKSMEAPDSVLAKFDAATMSETNTERVRAHIASRSALRHPAR
jgi:hypothetical protein